MLYLVVNTEDIKVKAATGFEGHTFLLFILYDYTPIRLLGEMNEA